MANIHVLTLAPWTVLLLTQTILFVVLCAKEPRQVQLLFSLAPWEVLQSTQTILFISSHTKEPRQVQHKEMYYLGSLGSNIIDANNHI
jgi:hypothetical protein